jgi:hypothetical protein
LATENASAPGSAPNEGTKVEWKKNDLLEGMDESAVLITANLPYLTPAEIESAEPRRYATIHASPSKEEQTAWISFAA